MRCTICGTAEEVWGLNLCCVVERRSARSFEIEGQEWVCVSCEQWAMKTFRLLDEMGAVSRRRIQCSQQV